VSSRMKSEKAAKLTALEMMKSDHRENPSSLSRLLFVQRLLPAGRGGREELPINSPLSARRWPF